jgi:alpha-galactosidase
MAKDDIITANYVEDLAAGDFNSPEWHKAGPVDIDQRWSGETAPSSQHAEVRILWSNEGLSVRFVCRQIGPPIVNPSPQLEHKTIGLWDRDVCEIFLAPNAETPDRYFEFEAAPSGEWVDLAVQVTPTKCEKDFDFQSHMTVAASLSDDQITIGMRIPWSNNIPKPNSGDEWLVNLFRCVGRGNRRYLAWQPTRTEVPNFHVPESFGRLRFV